VRPVVWSHDCCTTNPATLRPVVQLVVTLDDLPPPRLLGINAIGDREEEEEEQQQQQQQSIGLGRGSREGHCVL